MLEKIIRPMLVYAFLVVGLRLAGKRELAQLNPFDLVVLLTLSNTVQNAIIGNDNSVSGGLVGAATLLAMNYVVVRFVKKHHKLESIMQGQPVLLMQDGKILHDNMVKEMLCEDELLEIIRRHGIENVEDVDKMVLESSGSVNVIQRHPTGEELLGAELIERLDRIEGLIQARGPA